MAELPKTLTSYSPCFRKEKGAHGIEERGVYRIHQFEKQEMIVVCKPEESKDWYEKLWKNTVDLFRSMDIPVRTLECCSGDLADLKEKQIKRVIDAGITDIYLEEPEFWMRGGYSNAFKEEWMNYYGTPWQDQQGSPDVTYLSNKLKYWLYYRALDEIFSYAKEYGKSKGLEVKCYVPTHSLINYTSWQIVSPEASLASLDCVDGYIAQVWTGTSREPNYFKGVRKERVFENAFLEYGCMKSMTAPLGRKMYFLTDPIEDRAKNWTDYKINYQATFAAQLMYSDVDTYEVMPWSDRVYQGLYDIA